MKKSIKFFTNLSDPIDQLRENDLFVVLVQSDLLGIYTPTITNLSPYHTVEALIRSGHVEIISKTIEYDYTPADAKLEIDLGYDTSKP